MNCFLLPRKGVHWALSLTFVSDEELQIFSQQSVGKKRNQCKREMFFTLKGHVTACMKDLPGDQVRALPMLITGRLRADRVRQTSKNFDLLMIGFDCC